MAWCALDTLNLPILRPRKDGKAEKKKKQDIREIDTFEI